MKKLLVITLLSTSLCAMERLRETFNTKDPELVKIYEEYEKRKIQEIKCRTQPYYEIMSTKRRKTCTYRTPLRVAPLQSLFIKAKQKKAPA
jgi:hypothetical protein